MNRFAELRYARGLTQREVAKRSGVSLSTIIRLEHDQQRPGAATAKRLADFFGVSIPTLLSAPEREAA